MVLSRSSSALSFLFFLWEKNTSFYLTTTPSVKCSTLERGLDLLSPGCSGVSTSQWWLSTLLDSQSHKQPPRTCPPPTGTRPCPAPIPPTLPSTWPHPWPHPTPTTLKQRHRQSREALIPWIPSQCFLVSSQGRGGSRVLSPHLPLCFIDS